LCARRGIDPVALAEAYLRGGAAWVQVRQKSGGSGRFLETARSIAAAARPFEGRVIVNDRADIARMSGAAGVHVGQDDLPVEEAGRIAGAGALVGVSTHDAAQVDAALDGPAAYVAVGPIYGTATKDTGYTARGLELVRYAARRGKPVVAIGGISLDRVPELLDAGATALGVITDLLATGDPEQRTRDYLRAMNRI
jgi:thiamine-phosphate pyrophosphorylase